MITWKNKKLRVAKSQRRVQCEKQMKLESKAESGIGNRSELESNLESGIGNRSELESNLESGIGGRSEFGIEAESGIGVPSYTWNRCPFFDLVSKPGFEPGSGFKKL